MYLMYAFFCEACYSETVAVNFLCAKFQAHICDECHFDIEKCPVCCTSRAERESERFCCTNLFNGCKNQFPKHEIALHVSNCEYEKFRCPCNCRNFVSFYDLREHLNLENFWNDWYCTVYRRKSKRDLSLVVEFDGYLFLIRVRLLTDVHDYVLLNAACYFLNNIKSRKITGPVPYRCIIDSIWTGEENSVAVNHIDSESESCTETIVEAQFMDDHEAEKFALGFFIQDINAIDLQHSIVSID